MKNKGGAPISATIKFNHEDVVQKNGSSRKNNAGHGTEWDFKEALPKDQKHVAESQRRGQVGEVGKPHRALPLISPGFAVAKCPKFAVVWRTFPITMRDDAYSVSEKQQILPSNGNLAPA